MNACPCCANSMLRHIRRHEVYWFCRRCWKEMPLLERSPDRSLVSSSLEYLVVAASTRASVTV